MQAAGPRCCIEHRGWVRVWVAQGPAGGPRQAGDGGRSPATAGVAGDGGKCDFDADVGNKVRFSRTTLHGRMPQGSVGMLRPPLDVGNSG